MEASRSSLRSTFILVGCTILVIDLPHLDVVVWSVTHSEGLHLSDVVIDHLLDRDDRPDKNQAKGSAFLYLDGCLKHVRR